MKKKNSDFTVKVGDKEVKLKIMNINSDIRLESHKYYSKAFADALENKFPLRIEVEVMLKNKGLLNAETNEEESKDLRETISRMEMELRKGIKDNRKMTKDEGRELALAIRKARVHLMGLVNPLNQYYNNTAESYADNERVQFFIYSTTVHSDSGDRYWKSFDEFKSVAENDPVALAASNKFVFNYAGVDPDFEKELYENKWLRKMGFMNDNLQLLNAKGQAVDEEGRLVDPDGRFINDKGEFIDRSGNRVDEDGKLMVDEWGLYEQADSQEVLPPQ